MNTVRFKWDHKHKATRIHTAPSIEQNKEKTQQKTNSCNWRRIYSSDDKLRRSQRI